MISDSNSRSRTLPNKTARAKSSAAHLTGTEAAALLGVKPQTLYAYVSRGIIRSVAMPGSAKRLYSLTDIERLQARADARSGHGPVAAAAMHYGEPIIPTAITEITPAGPRYRGRSAIELARSGRSFENIAELLWTGVDADAAIAWEFQASAPDVSAFIRCIDHLGGERSISEVMSYVTMSVNMALGKSAQRSRYKTSTAAVRQLIFALTGCFGYLRPTPRYVPAQTGLSVAELAIRACGLSLSAERIRAVNTMMVLLADHELSPATFAVRIAASAGADLYTCLVCGLESGSGAKVAELFVTISKFLSGSGNWDGALGQLHELKTSQQVPLGFNHPAYPEGDPRAPLLLDMAFQLKRPTLQIEGLADFFAKAELRFGLKPRIEIGVAVLALAVGLPRGAAAGLYSLARIAGWTAHVLEQRTSNSILRPRARYMSDAPVGTQEIPSGRISSMPAH